MGLIWTLLSGLVIGALAKFVMPGDDPGGIIITILLGVAGSWIGSLVSGFIGFGDGLVMSIVLGVAGAVALLAGYRQIAANRS